jgi:hypothetical protein
MSFADVAVVAVTFMQTVNPLFGTFAPVRSEPTGVITIQADRISFANGVVLETTTEGGGGVTGDVMNAAGAESER